MTLSSLAKIYNNKPQFYSIEHTGKQIVETSVIYNQAGVTYNETGYTYGGAYGSDGMKPIAHIQVYK